MTGNGTTDVITGGTQAGTKGDGGDIDLQLQKLLLLRNDN